MGARIVEALPWIALAVLILALGAFVFWWWRRARSSEASQSGPLWRDLKQAWEPVRRDLSDTQRQLGTTVVALGDAAWGRAGTLEHLVGATASSGDTAPLRVHQGRDVVVLRLRDDLLLGEDLDADRALSRLAKDLSGVVLFVLGVDFGALHDGSELRLRAWAEALARTLPLFRKAGRTLGVRVCVTGLEDEPGYGPLRDLWSSGDRAPWTWAVARDPEAARRALRDAEERVGLLLGACPERFEATVRLLGALPERLRVLDAFTRPLTDVLRRVARRELEGVFLTDAEGHALPRPPFVLEPDALVEARAGLRRAAWRRTAMFVGAACAFLLACFVGHGFWLNRVFARVTEYRVEVERGPSGGVEPGEGETWGDGGVARRAAAPSEQEQLVNVQGAAPAAPRENSGNAAGVDESARGTESVLGAKAARAGAGVRSLRWWGLPFAGGSLRDQAGRGFVTATRQAFIAPYLHTHRSFARRVFATVLEGATLRNEFGELVLQHPAAWASLLRMPERTVGDFVHVRSDVAVARLTWSDLDAAARSVAEWRKLVLEISAAVQEGVFPLDVLERARANPLLRELPTSASELRLLKRAVDLVTSDLTRSEVGAGRASRHPLQEELGFIERNLADLVALRSWLDAAPGLLDTKAPTTLAQLLDQLAPAAPPKDAPEPGPGRVLEILFDGHPERIAEGDFTRALERTAGRAAYGAFLLERCGSSSARDDVLQRCPYLRSGYDGSVFFPRVAGNTPSPVDAHEVRGPGSGAYGPEAALPGPYTREAFDEYVAPALTQLGARLEGARLPSDDRRSLAAFIDGHLDAYGAQYFKALRSYWLSMRFAPVSLAAAKAAITEIAAPGSWFAEFVGTAAHHADLPLDGVEAAGLHAALQPFAAIVRVSQGKGLEQYGKTLLAVLAEADAATATPSGGSGFGGKRFGEALSALAALGQGANADVGKWLDGEQIVGEWRAPFEAPVASLRGQALQEVRRSWQHEIVRPAASILRRYPFSAAEQDLSASVEEVTQEFAPQGRLWTTVEELLTPVVVAGRGPTVHQRRQWSMRPGLPEPEGLLAYLNAAERLTTLLWLDDGERRDLAIALLPLELPSGTIGEPLIALAYLSLAGVGMQSFNQVSDETILEVPWWSREPSSLAVEVLDEHASEVKAYHEAASMPGPWSFLKLLDSGCARRRGDPICRELSWPVEKLSGRPLVRFDLAGDVGDVFRELARLADGGEVPVR